MKYQLKIEYEDGVEVHDLSDKETEQIIQYGRIDVNAMLRIAKKRRFNSIIKGDMKE